MTNDGYGDHPAYGTPQQPVGQYGPPPAPTPPRHPAAPGPPAYPPPGYGGPGGYDPAYIAGPRRMPATLSAARVLAYVAFGVAVLDLTAGIAFLDVDAREAGARFAGVILPLVAFVLALRARRARRTTRVWWIVVESLMLLSGIDGGLFLSLLAVPAIVLLSVTSTGDYFRTPREQRA
ncbi:hypothetical protein [Streptomyces sp. NPDC060194]|uniref:hypothetical protein n=1 Tax=Streptomyces sp. NPDC060194 TaxID=3347069 RepID=UPI00365BCE9F